MRDKKRKHISLTAIYMIVICLFPIATTLVNEGMVNKLLFSALIGLQLAMLFDRKATRRTIVMTLVLAVNFAYVVSHTKFPVANTNLFIYYPFYMIYTYFMCDNSSSVVAWFCKYRKYVISIIVIWTVLVGFSAFLPSSYYVKEGGASYFGSFSGSVFRLGQAAVFIQVLAIMIQLFYGYKKAILFHVLPMFCYFMGSSRTYLIVGLCFLLVAWYFYCGNKKKFYRSLIPMALMVLLAISVTSMGDKIAHTLDEDQYGDFWFKITSSRSVLWEANFALWKRAPLMRKLLGVWIDFSYRASGHWAHNDFVELIGSFGIVGLCHYLISIYTLFRTEKGQVKMPKFMSMILVFAWFFNAFFNMHYVYFCAMLCYPILVLGIKYYVNQNAAVVADNSNEELIEYPDEDEELVKRINNRARLK